MTLAEWEAAVVDARRKLSAARAAQQGLDPDSTAYVAAEAAEALANAEFQRLLRTRPKDKP